jgi:oligopeptidase B
MKVPPTAAKEPHEYMLHGQKHVDEYRWLQDTTKPEVRAYLKAENDFASAFMRPQKKTHREALQGNPLAHKRRRFLGAD